MFIFCLSASSFRTLILSGLADVLLQPGLAFRHQDRAEVLMPHKSSRVKEPFSYATKWQTQSFNDFILAFLFKRHKNYYKKIINAPSMR